MDNVKSEPQYGQMESKNVHLDKQLPYPPYNSLKSCHFKTPLVKLS